MFKLSQQNFVNSKTKNGHQEPTFTTSENEMLVLLQLTIGGQHVPKIITLILISLVGTDWAGRLLAGDRRGG
jgi:hypothetical protein